jgi:hypothetical protein
VCTFACRYWGYVQDVFQSLIVDHERHPINQTSVADLVAADQRLVM